MSITQPTPDQILNRRLVRIGHSHLTEPEYLIEGIGPAQFRSHFILLDNGLVIDLFVAFMTISAAEAMVCEGQTDGIPVNQLLGKTITNVWNDDTQACIVILDHDIYLKDANDCVYGNPLHAGYIYEDYTPAEIAKFTDHWTQNPVIPDETTRSTHDTDRGVT